MCLRHRFSLRGIAEERILLTTEPPEPRILPSARPKAQSVWTLNFSSRSAWPRERDRASGLRPARLSFLSPWFLLCLKNVPYPDPRWLDIDCGGETEEEMGALPLFVWNDNALDPIRKDLVDSQHA